MWCLCAVGRCAGYHAVEGDDGARDRCHADRLHCQSRREEGEVSACHPSPCPAQPRPPLLTSAALRWCVGSTCTARGCPTTARCESASCPSSQRSPVSTMHPLLTSVALCAVTHMSTHRLPALCAGSPVRPADPSPQSAAPPRASHRPCAHVPPVYPDHQRRLPPASSPRCLRRCRRLRPPRAVPPLAVHAVPGDPDGGGAAHRAVEGLPAADAHVAEPHAGDAARQGAAGHRGGDQHRRPRRPEALHRPRAPAFDGGGGGGARQGGGEPGAGDGVRPHATHTRRGAAAPHVRTGGGEGGDTRTTRPLLQEAVRHSSPTIALWWYPLLLFSPDCSAPALCAGSRTTGSL